jgi:hypothetical protein
MRLLVVWHSEHNMKHRELLSQQAILDDSGQMRAGLTFEDVQHVFREWIERLKTVIGNNSEDRVSKKSLDSPYPRPQNRPFNPKESRAGLNSSPGMTWRDNDPAHPPMACKGPHRKVAMDLKEKQRAVIEFLLLEYCRGDIILMRLQNV